MYPVKNSRYIDILFLATGATTQGGLNTVNVNELTLYQQLVIYLTCIMATPIVIHGCLAFVRLYWFERYFDGIRDSSKKNFEMRRTRTILERELTARTITKNRTNMSQNSRYSRQPNFGNGSQRDDFQEKLFSGKMVNRDENDVLSRRPTNIRDDSSRFKNKLSREDNMTGNNSRHAIKFQDQEQNNDNNSDHFIREQEKFVQRRHSQDISPTDMYRSIMMLRNQHEEHAENEGPALVIKAPSGSDDKKGNDNKNTHSERITGENSSSVKQSRETISNDNTDHDDNDADDADDAGLTSNVSYGGSLSEVATGSESSHDIADETTEEGLTSPFSTEESFNSVSPQSRSKSPLRNLSMNKGFNSTSELNNTDENHVHYTTEPTIQFDISKPPRIDRRKRKLAPKPRPSYFGYTKRSSRNILKHIPKGRRFRKHLKRRLSTNSVAKPNNEELTGKSPVEHPEESDDGDFEEYFADNETDEDEINQPIQTYRPPPPRHRSSSYHNTDISVITNGLKKSKTYDMALSKELDELSQKPDFQKMVYQNWKSKHKKNARFPHIYHTKTGLTATTDSEDQRNLSSSNGDNSLNSQDYDDSELESRYNTTGMYDGENSERDNGLDEEANYYGLHFDPDVNLTPLHAPFSRTMSTNYLSWQPTIGRNSNFYNLTQSQKDELGGVEYRAIKLLCTILLVYYIGFNIMAFVMLVPWICVKKQYIAIVRSDGISPAWWGFFTAMSSFADLGLTVTPDSMSSFDTSIYPQIVMMWFIIIGNTGFPVLLRFIIWVMFKLAPDLSQRKESLGFLLDHPRRCFTLLFPSAATWWLLIVLLALNITDLILFVILDFSSSYLKGISRGHRVLMGLFQGVCTRTAGFSVMNISDMHASIQVSYMLMMYVSVLPLAISIRRTNVYEEQSLGIYGDVVNPEDVDGEEDENDDEDEEDEEYEDDTHSSENSKDNTSNSSSSTPKKKNSDKKPSATSFIGAHLRRQLSFDLWYLFLGLFVICICENNKIKDINSPNFNVFAILFELVSAYGTVGLSFGYPNTNESFSGRFTTLSKLVIIAMLIRGRNRGLPYSLDRAIILPSERLEHIDHIEDLKLKRRRASTKDSDAMTGYIKKNTRWLRHGIRKGIRRSNTVHSGPSRDAYLMHDIS